MVWTKWPVLFAILFLGISSSSIAGNYAFVQKDEQLEQLKVELPSCQKDDNKFIDFLQIIQDFGSYLGGKFELVSTYLDEKKGNFLENKLKLVYKNIIIAELLESKKSRFSILVKPIIRILADSSEDPAICEVIDPSEVYNYVLFCDITACIGELLMRKSKEETWTRKAILSDEEVKAFKLELRRIFWQIP